MALALCAEHVYVARMTNDVLLPTDLEACHRLLREQQGVISECHTVITEKDVVITECRTALAAKDALVAQQNQQLVEQKERLVEIQLRLRAKPAPAARSTEQTEALGSVQRIRARQAAKRSKSTRWLCR
jgi:hypothetical protein